LRARARCSLSPTLCLLLICALQAPLLVCASPRALIELGLSPPSEARLTPLDAARELLRQGRAEEALAGPLASAPQLDQLKVNRAFMSSKVGRKALLMSAKLAWQTLKWRALKALSEAGPHQAATQEAGAVAEELLRARSTPEALQSELRLSLARAQAALKLTTAPHEALEPPLALSLRELRESPRARIASEALKIEAQLASARADQPAAAEAQRALWLSYGHSPLGSRVPAPPTASARDWRERGLKLFKERDYQPALEALSQALKFSEREPLLSELERAEAALLSAVSLMRLRVEQRRSEQLLAQAWALLQPPAHHELSPAQAQLPTQDEERRALKASVLRYQSFLWARQARWDEAINANRALITLSSGARRDEARYQVGRLLHQAGRFREAFQAHEAYLQTQPRDPERARWFYGWSAYRGGDCPAARRAWAPLLNKPNLLEGPQARYWTARCYALEGQTARAKRELRALFKRAPISYYGLLGRQLRAKLQGEEFSWPHPLRGRAGQRARRRHLKLARPLSLKRLTRGGLWRSERSAPLWEALALKELGLDGYARAQWRASCQQPPRELRRALGAQATPLCERVGLYVGAHGDLWRRGRGERAGWRVAGYGGLLERPTELRVSAYPLAYEELTRAAAAEEGLSAGWLLAHMLQESRYRPEVVSHAQAIGLMQILERTGRRISERLGWPPAPFSGELLFKPSVALRLSAWYLKQLWLDLGHPILAMAAYNGGPMRIADHVAAHPELPMSELIEELGAHESRNYMRKVTDHTLRYLALYADKEEWAAWTARLALPERAPQAKRTVGF